MSKLKYYIKQRYNPQLGTYYIKYGQITKEEAKNAEDRCVYGSNKMLKFNTEKEYLSKIDELKKSGESVQD